MYKVLVTTTLVVFYNANAVAASVHTQVLEFTSFEGAVCAADIINKEASSKNMQQSALCLFGTV